MYRLRKINLSSTGLFENEIVAFDENTKDEASKNHGPKLSVIIGPNGTGKSLILQTIAKNIRRLYIDKNTPQSYNSSEIPQRLICISPGISDRFPEGFRRRRGLTIDPYQDFYFYLGKRGTAGSFSPRIFLYKCLDYLADWVGSAYKNINLVEVLSEFGFEPVIRISYEFLRQDKAIDEYGPNSKLAHEAKPVPPWFELSELKKLVSTLGKKNRKDEFLIDLRKPNQVSTEYLFLRYFNFLRAEKFLRVTSCLIHRPGDVSYDISQLSSGEANLFLSFISLSSVIRDDSLILIDEPEISLHPNWQISFIPAIKKIFRNFSSCHFIISTHSPYLCSEIDTIDNIVRTRKNTASNFKTDNYEVSTYGWSVEKILLEVFDVATVRNFYFEQKVRTLLDFLKDSSSVHPLQVDQILTEVGKFTLSNSDPLKRLINSIETIRKKGAPQDV